MFCNLSAWRRRDKLCYLCPAEETSITGVAVALLKGADGRWFYQCTGRERTPSRCNPPDHSRIFKKKKKQHMRWTYASSYNLEPFVTEHLHECTHMAIAVMQCKYIHVNQRLRSILPFFFFLSEFILQPHPSLLGGKGGRHPVCHRATPHQLKPSYRLIISLHWCWWWLVFCEKHTLWQRTWTALHLFSIVLLRRVFTFCT